MSLERQIVNYFTDFWNMLDFTTITIMFCCLGLRVAVWADGYPYTEHGVNGLYLDAGGGGYLDGGGTLGLSFFDRNHFMQWIQICFSVSCVLVFIRFLETMSIFSNMGVLVTIVIAMLKESIPILALLLVLAVAFGIALTGLLPQEQTSTNAFMRPFFYPFRAFLGDFDLSQVYEILGDADTPVQHVMGTAAFWLLYLYAYITTITIVNLMIAQMTQAYERIESESKIFRKYQKVELIREYKDKRAPVPPPFIVFFGIGKIINNLLRGRCCRPRGGSDEAAEVETGFADYVWLSRSDEYLKKEREYQQRFLKAEAEEGEVTQRIERVAYDTKELREDQERNNETMLGRFERLDVQLAKLAKSLGPRGEEDKSDVIGGVSLGRPSYVSPARLMPINYVQDAYSKTAPALPPTSARPRHEPLQAGPAPPYTGTGVASYGRPALAAVRESQAYLSSVAQLPLTQGSLHRNAPRLAQSMPRSSLQAQADMQLMDSARRVFQSYDRDASGDIDAQELQPALRDLGLIDVDSVQVAAILARYDTNRNTRLDFVEFTQLLHELREFQAAANRAAEEAPSLSRSLPASIGVMGGAAGGGMGGYYSPTEIRELTENAAREAAESERARLGEDRRLTSLDAGPPP